MGLEVVGDDAMKPVTIILLFGWLGYAMAFLIMNIFPKSIPWFLLVLIVFVVIALKKENEK